MSQRTFRKRMACGLGSCYLELKNADAADTYRDTVLRGCLHPIAFDAQSEGTRAAYLYRLISVFPDRAFFAEKIAEKYRSFSGRDTGLFWQLTELLSFFAADGSQTAKDALAGKYGALYTVLLQKRRFSGYDFPRDCFECLCVVLLRNGGVPPEKMIADYGELFRKNPRYGAGDFDWFIFSLEEAMGRKNLLAVLKNGEKTPAWKCFEQEYRKTSGNKEKTPAGKIAQTVSAEAFRQLIEKGSGDGRAYAVLFARRADDTEKQKLAVLIEAEALPERKAGMLLAFRTENYPGNHEELVGYTSSDCPELARTAAEVLEHCQSDAAYRYGKERFRKDGSDPAALGILITNYHRQDKEALLFALAALPVSRDERSGWHGIVMRILDAGERGVRLSREFFDYIYENSLCSRCRERAVRYMGKHRWLSRERIAECCFDSNDAIAAYAEKRKTQINFDNDTCQ